MSDILTSIVEHKRLEIKELKVQIESTAAVGDAMAFPAAIRRKRAAGAPFFIFEFKRKSPSEGWINREADLKTQIFRYVEAGAGAISVLTDGHFFGGSHTDLREAAALLRTVPPEKRPLLLQKDFVLEAPQIAQAKACGADIILLIAAILSPEKLLELKNFATSLGLGVLVEVHDESELARIQHLDFQVLGINSRDLKTFRTALNRVNVLRQKAAGRLVIAESGVRDHLDFQAVRQADGFLIGTGLMRTADNSQSPASRSPIFNFQFSQFKNFKISKPSICKLINLQISESPSLQISKFPNFPISKFRNLPIFKACGIRSPEQLHNCPADLLGINFSPLSKRRFPLELLDNQTIPANAVAVFYKNSEAEIREILEKFKFGRVQVYAGDLSPEFVKTLRQRVILACALRQAADLDTLEAYAPDVDFFILDAAVPGSGERIGAAIPPDFPYPFLLAGGLNADNLHIFKAFENCIGIDVASGIETAGALDLAKVEAVLAQLKK